MHILKSYIIVLKEKILILLCVAGILSLTPHILRKPSYMVSSMIQYNAGSLRVGASIETKEDLKSFLNRDSILSKTKSFFPKKSFLLKNISTTENLLANIDITASSLEIAKEASSIFTKNALQEINGVQNLKDRKFKENLIEQIDSLQSEQNKIQTEITSSTHESVISEINFKKSNIPELREEFENINKRISELKKNSSNSSLQRVSYEQLPGTKEKRKSIERISIEIDSLAQTLGTKHPKMLALEQRFFKLKKQLKAGLAFFKKEQKSELTQVIEKKKEISLAIDESQNFIDKNSSALSKLKILNQSADKIKKQMHNLETKLSQFSINSSENKAFAKKINSLVVHKKNLDLVSAGRDFCLILLLGMFSILFTSLRKPSLINKDFATNYLQVPTISEIPNLNFEVSNDSGVIVLSQVEHKQQDFMIEHQETAQLPVVKKSSLQKTISFNRKISKQQKHEVINEAKEAFKFIRTSNILNTKEQNKVILVTSAHKGEGKTTLAINLATSFSKAGFKTLLLKTDLQESNHETSVMGLADYLVSSCSLSEIVHESGVENLWISPRGIYNKDCNDMLSSKRFNSFIESSKELFDHIIIDGSECLNKSDSLVIASLADKTIIVSDMERTDRKDVKQTVKRLEQFGASISGVVLNNPSKTQPAKTQSKDTYKVA